MFKNIKGNGAAEQSNIANIPGVQGEAKLYPNPVAASKVTLQFVNMDKGRYEVTIYSSEGQKLASQKLQHNGGTNVYALSLKSSWTGGVYRVNIINEDSKKSTNLNLVISK